MRILKSYPLLKIVNSFVIDSPTPSNISYLWNFGSLLGFCLVIQIVTGVTLGMHYTPNVLEAFDSVEHIMRDVNNGWLIRYLHSNTASAFFFLVYLHIGRGLYYGSYKAPRTLVWIIGTVIFILMMATAFLGYNYSLKWSKLNLYISILNTFSLIQNNNYIIIILSFIFTISFIIFYLDNFKLSNNIYMKLVQIFSFAGMLFLLIVTMCNTYNLQDFVCFVKDNSIDLHGHVSLDKDAGKYVGQGLSTIGSNIGLGASMAGIASAVSKGIAKSSMPPLQKAGIIMAGAISGGFAHSIITTVNRKNISNIHDNNIHSNINKFVDNSLSSSLQTLLFDIEGLNITCLSLVILLIIQIIFKLYLKDNITLKFSNILGKKFNTNLEYYINKIINLNKKMSTIYIWLTLLILIFSLSFSIYAAHELYSNLDGYITEHTNIKK
jgi:Cytochrome b/b6/petB